MAKTQNIKINFKNDSAGTKFSKTFKDFTNNTFADTDDMNDFATKYSKLVDGTYIGGESQTIEPFDAA